MMNEQDDTRMTGFGTRELSAELQRLLAARHHDPFSVLGRHCLLYTSDAADE